MLADHQSQLLTAYVDGELDPRQARSVEQLLASSPEARQLLEQLMRDSAAIKDLPAQSAPVTLADCVMETVNESQPLPISRPAARRPVAAPRLGAWFGLAAAACVLLAVFSGAFWGTSGLLRSWRSSDAGTGVVVEPGNAVKTPPMEARADVKPDALDPALANLFGAAAEHFGDQVAGTDAGVRLLTTEMNAPATKVRLAHELKKAPAWWFDVPATKSQLAVDELKESFQKAGIRVVEAGARVAKAQKPRTGYILYAENLRHEELTAILVNFGKIEAAAPEKQSASRLVMKAVTDKDRDTIARAMRLPPKEFASAKVGPFLDLPTFIDASPSATGKSGNLVPGPERLAVLIPVSGIESVRSDEMHRFLASRQPLRQGTIQVVLYIHESNS